MWKPEHRRERRGLRYPSDLTDAGCLQQLLTPPPELPDFLGDVRQCLQIKT
jgi:hypothetical protein